MELSRFAWKTPVCGSSTDRVSHDGRQRLTILFGFAAHVCILIICESSSFLNRYCSWYRQDRLEVNPLIVPASLSLNDFFVMQLSSKMWLITARPTSRVLLRTSFLTERTAKKDHKPSKVPFDHSSDNSRPLMVAYPPY